MRLLILFGIGLALLKVPGSNGCNLAESVYWGVYYTPLLWQVQ